MPARASARHGCHSFERRSQPQKADWSASVSRGQLNGDSLGKKIRGLLSMCFVLSYLQFIYNLFTIYLQTIEKLLKNYWKTK
jgi:hypothetical protein